MVVSNTFLIFTPICGRFPIWQIFFRWVATTNQLWPWNFDFKFRFDTFALVILFKSRQWRLGQLLPEFSIIMAGPSQFSKILFISGTSEMWWELIAGMIVTTKSDSSFPETNMNKLHTNSLRQVNVKLGKDPQKAVFFHRISRIRRLLKYDQSQHRITS